MVSSMEADERIRFLCEFADEGISEPQSRSSCGSRWKQRDSVTSEGYSTASESCSCAECDGSSRVVMDSLTLALEELRSGQTAANFFEAHQRIGDSDRGSYEFLQKSSHKRSSSLKTQKTPPGTPNQMKKAVRFADAFGLDLTYVRHVFDQENPPVIPPQATRHLNLPDSDEDDGQGSEQCGRDITEPRQKFVVSPRFPQPGDSPCFSNRVAAQKVLLERATFVEGCIEGRIRVANIGFEKAVTVRATSDNWSSVQQHLAVYSFSSNDGATDQFCFKLPAEFTCSSTLTFCIRYSVNNETFWDNNFGENYCFDCFTVNLAVGECD